MKLHRRPVRCRDSKRRRAPSALTLRGEDRPRRSSLGRSGIAAVSARTTYAADAAPPAIRREARDDPADAAADAPAERARSTAPMHAAMTPLTPVAALPTSVLLFPPDIER